MPKLSGISIILMLKNETICPNFICTDHWPHPDERPFVVQTARQFLRLLIVTMVMYESTLPAYVYAVTTLAMYVYVVPGCGEVKTVKHGC